MKRREEEMDQELDLKKMLTMKGSLRKNLSDEDVVQLLAWWYRQRSQDAAELVGGYPGNVQVIRPAPGPVLAAVTAPAEELGNLEVLDLPAMRRQLTDPCSREWIEDLIQEEIKQN